MKPQNSMNQWPVANPKVILVGEAPPCRVIMENGRLNPGYEMPKLAPPPAEQKDNPLTRIRAVGK
jgi:hypothetical protein